MIQCLVSQAEGLLRESNKKRCRASRGGRIKTKEVREHAEKPSQNCLLLDNLYAWHGFSVKDTSNFYLLQQRLQYYFFISIQWGNK